MIKDELNVKKVVFRKGKGKLKAELDTKITRQLLEEGKMRDLIRQIQELRKKAGLDLNSPVTVAGPWFPATPKLRAFLQQKVLAKELVEADDLRLV